MYLLGQPRSQLLSSRLQFLKRSLALFDLLLLSILSIKARLLLDNSGQLLLGRLELSFSQSQLALFHVEEEELGLDDFGSLVVVGHGTAPLADTLEGGRGALGNVTTEHFALLVISEREFEVGSE